MSILEIITRLNVCKAEKNKAMLQSRKRCLCHHNNINNNKKAVYKSRSRHWHVFCKKDVWEILAKSLKNTCERIQFLVTRNLLLFFKISRTPSFQNILQWLHIKHEKLFPRKHLPVQSQQ